MRPQIHNIIASRVVSLLIQQRNVYTRHGCSSHSKLRFFDWFAVLQDGVIIDVIFVRGTLVCIGSRTVSDIYVHHTVILGLHGGQHVRAA